MPHAVTLEQVIAALRGQVLRSVLGPVARAQTAMPAPFTLRAGAWGWEAQADDGTLERHRAGDDARSRVLARFIAAQVQLLGGGAQEVTFVVPAAAAPDEELVDATRRLAIAMTVQALIERDVVPDAVDLRVDGAQIIPLAWHVGAVDEQLSADLARQLTAVAGQAELHEALAPTLRLTFTVAGVRAERRLGR